MASVDDALRRILPLLTNVKRNGSGYTARCPGHDDRANSLSIRMGDDGRVLVHCFVGCAPEHITASLGLTMSDLYMDSEERRSRKGPRVHPGGESRSPSGNT